MSTSLVNKRVAILATNGCEESELLEPQRMLNEAGAETVIISLAEGEIKSWKDGNWGNAITVDQTVDQSRAEDFDALLLPGGVLNPDQLRINADAVRFSKSFMEWGKPVGAICHGPWLLLETGTLEGKEMTSWPSLKTDLENGGADWVDQEVVVDAGLVTSRKPADIPAFGRKLIEEIAEGVHARSA